MRRVDADVLQLMKSTMAGEGENREPLTLSEESRLKEQVLNRGGYRCW